MGSFPHGTWLGDLCYFRGAQLLTVNRLPVPFSDFCANAQSPLDTGKGDLNKQGNK